MNARGVQERDAEISPCGRYRYSLRRRWGIGRPGVAKAHCDDDCPCFPCPVCHPLHFEDDNEATP